jgi:peptide-methionine (S)-S-oxide reductase
LLILLLAVGATGPTRTAVAGRTSPAAGGAMNDHRTEIATLAGGCFWCLEAVFEQLEGVERVVSGYSGGSARNPTYEQVSSGATGHAESVQITFDPARLPYRELLRIFFAFHDPTTVNRQGADVGTQYRSAIFWHDPRQRATAEEVIAELERKRVFEGRIVTQLAPYAGFHPAEEHNQGYYDKNPGQPYCRIVISPKVAKLRQAYAGRLKAAR